MRRKKHGAERIAACSEILIPTPITPAVHPQSFFSEERPVCLEIGCGKGDFAVGMSAKHQNLNFIAMERVPDVACLALEKAMAANAPVVIECVIDSDDKVFPMVPAGAPIVEAFDAEDLKNQED
jgi:tRNA G46 methylase TrmB